MDPQESEFFEKLMGTFREEAKEHLKTLSDGFLELEQNLSKDKQKQLIEAVFREAHSLKGAARSVNQQNILEICQALETVLSLWKQDKIEISPRSFDILHATIDIISEALSASLDPSVVDNTVGQLKALSEKTALPTPSASREVSDASSIAGRPLKEAIDLVDEGLAGKADSTVAGPSLLNPPQKSVLETDSAKSKNLSPPAADQKGYGKTIRISLEKMDRLFQEAEETLMIKLFFKQQLSDLKKMQDEGFTKESFNKLLKNTEINAHVVETTIDTLLEDLKKILMQPMSTLFETLPHMIRDISRDLAKEVHVEFQGGDIEVDRRVLEEIKDPVIHLIRNAIDHGIESPQERVKQNKPPSGVIRVTATESNGNKVKLSIADDGPGINLVKIKQIALKKEFISQTELDAISDEDAIKLAFHSGVSTSPIITELSGRGLGLGIVSEKVDKLGGYTEVVTLPNQGTTFTLTLPLTLATFRGILITVADQDFILPTHYVQRVVEIKSTDIKKAENRETITLGNRSYSFIFLADLLGIKRTTILSQNDSLLALIVKAAEQTIVFGIDNVHREQEILVKSLGKQVIRVKNIMAATVLETGQVIPILNPVDLIKSSIKGVTTSSSVQPKAPKKSILVVEDSITTRLLLKNILTSEDYEVTTAVDGVEAFDILQHQTFDLLVTDVDMPRMNGFELTEKVRGMPQKKELPIIICTALGSRGDRERGIELGANAYLDKDSFDNQSFINIIKKLI